MRTPVGGRRVVGGGGHLQFHFSKEKNIHSVWSFEGSVHWEQRGVRKMVNSKYFNRTTVIDILFSLNMQFKKKPYSVNKINRRFLWEKATHASPYLFSFVFNDQNDRRIARMTRQLELLESWKEQKARTTGKPELAEKTEQTDWSLHQYIDGTIKGTVPRDFRRLFFFMNQFPPSRWVYQ